MKIIELCRLTEGGESLVDDDFSQCDPRDWWCVIETEEERKQYDNFVEHLGEYGDCREVEWNKQLIKAGEDMGLCWGDDDVYGYLMPDEDHPAVGEEMIDSDGDKWVRTA